MTQSLAEILLGVATFTAVVLALVGAILLARRKLVPSGEVTVRVNDRREFSTPVGGKLLGVLAANEIYVSSACGGGGTCAQCLVRVSEGGGDILPTEKAHITRRMAREGYRLSCQVAVKRDLRVVVPDEALETRKWNCTVRSNRNVATFIKELVLELPPGEEMDFKPGGFIQVEVPPHRLSFTDFQIDQVFRDAWDREGLWSLESRVEEPVVRAYSMANYPGEKGVIKLNIRIATPPPGANGAPPGKASSYLFSLRPGQGVTLSGPYGEFFIKETDAEMIYIGGGAGMAPLRSHVFELFKNRKTRRRVSYWYGARSGREMFYEDEFRDIEKAAPNFSFHVALSEPLPEDRWTGPTGFIHQVVRDQYLKDHPAPEDCEYYICGPVVMLHAVRDMLDDLGVEPENIAYDDFGF